MTEFKNTEKELHIFHKRLFIIALLMIICFAVLLVRLVWLQVIQYDSYATRAEENRIAIVPIVPSRGIITDRNGVVLASNVLAYTLEITPSEITEHLDDLIDKLSNIVNIEPKHRRRFKKIMEEGKSFTSFPLRTRLTEEEVARLAAEQFRFPGVTVEERSFRYYPLGEVASHVVGYIGRVSNQDQERLAHEEAQNYKGTQYIGKEGIEKSYEAILHGQTGHQQVEITAGGRAVKSLLRTNALPGSHLTLSIDIELQKIVEEAFGHKRGAFVAMDPQTGEVLAFVSKPTYDPNLFVEGIDQISWDALNHSPDKPLLNRALISTYPPGSTYKPFMGLAALTLGLRTPTDSIADKGYFTLGNHRFRDDKVGGHGLVNLHQSIVVSCDTYYYELAHDMGVDAIYRFMHPFGFGQKTGIDLAHERAGILPSTTWKKNYYKKPAQQTWYKGETISLGIGQGYNSFTLLQLAHALVGLVNNGRFLRPHLVKTIIDPLTHEKKPILPQTVRYISLNPAHVALIKNAMVDVTKVGTAAPVFSEAPYTSGGKTGTAQVIGIKKNERYNVNKIASQFHDHALYIAFAPSESPRIALAMVVENGGFGAAAAAPIAKLALDYFLLGKKPEDKEKTRLAELNQEKIAVESSDSELASPDMDDADEHVLDNTLP